MIQKIVNLMLLVASLVTLAGCNTIHGIGKDIEKGGQAIEKAAK